MQSRPNFFIVGAPKSGTTSLFHYLSLHPNLFASPVKEPYFFCDDFKNLKAGQTLDDYLALFEGASDKHQAIGEASVSYLYSNSAISNIREFNSDARIIVMVRNPCELVYSVHSQLLYLLDEQEKDFEKAWMLQNERSKGINIPKKTREPFFLQYREIGMLGKHIERIYDIFPRDQIKILFQSDMQDDVHSIYYEVVQFLGLPPFEPTEFPVLNSNKEHRSRILAHIAEAPKGPISSWTIDTLKKVLGYQGRGLREKLRKANFNRTQRPPLSDEMQATLKTVFRTDVEKLSEITNRDLRHWVS